MAICTSSQVFGGFGLAALFLVLFVTKLGQIQFANRGVIGHTCLLVKTQTLMLKVAKVEAMAIAVIFLCWFDIPLTVAFLHFADSHRHGLLLMRILCTAILQRFLTLQKQQLLLFVKRLLLSLV